MTFIFCFLLVAAAPSDAALMELRSEFKSAVAFEANFQQEIEQDLFPEQPQVAEGRLSFKRPKSLEWVYEKPQQRRIRYDGEKLVIEESGETQETTSSARINLEEAFSFLWGEADPKLFDLKSSSKNSFSLEPKLEDAGFKRIEVFVADGRVSRAIITDPLDGKSTLRFSAWKLHKKSP